MIASASIPSPGSSGLQLGPFEIHAYGLLYVVGLGAALLITARRWQAQGGSRSLVYDVALWGFPAGLLGGRLYFDLTSSGEVPPHWWGPLAVWDGGMGIWGGIALGTFVGLWRLRRAGISPAPFMDAAAPGLLVGQAIGRIGNYFNQELFGGPTNLPWGLQISPAHRPAGYAAFSTFHPTFLYELIWDLGLAAFLIWLGHRRRISPPGLFALYVTGYSAFRIFEESLRVDPAHHILGLRLNFYVACLLTAAGALWFLAIQWRGRPVSAARRKGSAALAIGAVALFACGCGQAGSRAVIEAPTLKPAPGPSPKRPTPRSTRKPLAGRIIGIDPGHNGRNYSDPAYIDHLVWNGRERETCDTTGTETDGGYSEARFNFNVAERLAADLRAEGARVVLTRHTNHGIGPCVTRRARIIDRANADVAIDIHADGGPPGGRGFAILEPVADGPNDGVIGASRVFGRLLLRSYHRITGMPISDYDGAGGVSPRENLAGLNLTTVPKVLIECGNMRNSADATRLVSPAFQRRAARALATAIALYLS